MISNQNDTNIEKLESDNELFDREVFSDQITTDNNYIATFQTTLKQAQEVLDERYKTGTHIREIIYSRAWLIDQILQFAWSQFRWTQPSGICLIAVGGYGRGELHPHSDIDLLILLRQKQQKQYKNSIEKFLTFLWDINLQIGHSVRSLTECKKEAAKDITIATSLMESRTIVGDEELHAMMTKAVGPAKIWPNKHFFQAKRQEQIVRHRKYNNTEYNLEPNIKGSPGGLRDIQMIGWVAKRYFGVKDLYKLVEYNFLTESEYSILMAGQDFLWSVRYGLHMLSGRSEDRLLFDYQPSLATTLGYSDDRKNLAVEQFMQKYYRVVLAIGELNDVLLQHFDEVILHSKRRNKIVKLNNRFQTRNNYIEVINDNVFQQTPFALIEIFVLMAQHPEIQGVRAATIRLIRDHRHLIDDKFRNDIRNTTLFIELLRSPYALFTQLRRMKRYGILGCYLPEFGHIIGKMQYDLFHIYTVDAHTLLVIKNMRRLRYVESIETFPVAAQVVKLLPKIELLYIAGLYHDIAKGRGGDHSILGSEDAKRFCLNHHLSQWDANLVAWLVKHHLLMSMTAQRKDLSDPKVIREFALNVRDQVHLDYLYTLTVSDICATNPNLWNSWRATLLRQLYSETKRALLRGLENPIDKQEWIDETQKNALTILAETTANQDNIITLWNQLGDEYFLQNSSKDIAWHTDAILNHINNKPLVLIKSPAENQDKPTQIFIYTEDREYLFAATVAVLDQLNLNIFDARVITATNHYSLDSYTVLEEDDQPIGNNPTRINEINKAIIQALSNPDAYPETIQRHTSRRLKLFSIPTETTINHDLANNRTVLEVITPDRPGLLAKIGKIFLEFNINLQKAKIFTLGERVEDVFFIADRENNPLTNRQICDKLEQTICQQLDEQMNNSSNQSAKDNV